jgi:hypothetical protein
MVLLGQPLSEKTRTAVLGSRTTRRRRSRRRRSFRAGVGKAGRWAIYMAGCGAFGANADQKNMVPDDRQAAIMAGLMLGSPEFQRR